MSSNKSGNGIIAEKSGWKRLNVSCDYKKITEMVTKNGLCFCVNQPNKSPSILFHALKSSKNFIRMLPLF